MLILFLYLKYKKNIEDTKSILKIKKYIENTKSILKIQKNGDNPQIG